MKDIDEWRKCGLPVTEADNRVNIGVDSVRRLMEQVAPDGGPMLRIDPRCSKLIRDLQDLRIDDDVGDDLADCLRYAVCSILEGESDYTGPRSVVDRLNVSSVSHNYYYDGSESIDD